MPNYYAALKRYDSIASFTMTFSSTDTNSAIDAMLEQCSVISVVEEVEEYELYRILEDERNAYVPVARKYKRPGTALIVAPPTEERAYTEQVYVSYRDVA